MLHLYILFVVPCYFKPMYKLLHTAYVQYAQIFWVSIS